MRILTQFAARLLPQDCLLCEAPAADALLCPACAAELPRPAADRCPVCALPAPGGATCGACLRKTPHFDASFALYRYGFPVDRLVQALKYGHELAVARFFATAMLNDPPPLVADLFLAVPLSAARLSERGFNQALEIARPLARRFRRPLAVAGCLRTLDTPPQAMLPWPARQKNIRDAFECRLDLSGKRVVVIDDVMTTGATLDEFARTLKKHGASHVANWVVARAIKD